MARPERLPAACPDEPGARGQSDSLPPRLGSKRTLRLDAEAGSSLGNALVVPGHPVALAKLGSHFHALLLVDFSRGELRRDLLVLVEVALEAARRQDFYDPN